jgi:hypothetical protein
MLRPSIFQSPLGEANIDHFMGAGGVRSLGYLISAKSTPDLPTVAVVLAEAAQAAANYARERAID